MARSSKKPKYDAFNASINAFGPRAQDPKKWESYLNADLPIYLELGCGKAEVTLVLAALHPQNSYIGVDLKADRLWVASKKAKEQKLPNVALFQANILELNEIFKDQSISGIWITFPDPYPKKRQAKHRMLNRKFLDVYKALLKPGATIRFKTDNIDLFQWTLELLIDQKDVLLGDVSFDLHESELSEETKILTTYESRFIIEGLRINYLDFVFKRS